MVSHPSRVFPLQWPLSGTTQPAVMRNITLTFIFKVCCSLPLNPHRSARLFACLANQCVLLRILEKLPDPDLSLQAVIQEGLKCHERKQMRLPTLHATLFFFLSFFFINQTMVVALPLYHKLECFDKFPKAEVNWSFVLKWVTWRVNAQRPEFSYFPIWKESPELSCPLRAPQKKGLIIHGW